MEHVVAAFCTGNLRELTDFGVPFLEPSPLDARNPFRAMTSRPWTIRQAPGIASSGK